MSPPADRSSPADLPESRSPERRRPPQSPVRALPPDPRLLRAGGRVAAAPGPGPSAPSGFAPATRATRRSRGNPLRCKSARFRARPNPHSDRRPARATIRPAGALAMHPPDRCDGEIRRTVPDP